MDLVGYRRFGHNEWMNHQLLNPVPYQNIRKHDSVEYVFGKKLVNEGVISEDEMHSFIEQVQKELDKHMIKINKADKWIIQIWKNLQNLHYRYTNNHLRLII
ncbi:thiamine pyrophosphate-dependent enzyme [Staphylococcus aureus]